MACNPSFGDVVVTRHSPNEIFSSTGSGAMEIDSDGDKDSGIGIHMSQHPSPNTTHTIDQPLTTFHLFTHLPPKICKRIWTLAAPEPRTRFLELHSYNMIDHTPRLRYMPALPPLFAVSREARNISIAHEGGEIIHFTSITGGLSLGTAAFYIAFPSTVVWLSSRFTAACNTTETFRLHKLSSILPVRFVARVKVILITYSGLDAYAHIGPVLRPYASLETLYVGMVDNGSSGVVMTLLGRGVPETGEVARRIERDVRETEAEETDDDEESEEMLNGRLAVRQRRRIVEVNIRLDG
ncbi:hypothetical protein EJ02DRAFT_457164 [Clathrospora elynae]|uniref:2EXR domain-containing protein n=1 Tax=Clathrospora elynae TaxID=706981 RepID=A0A6A5SH75_9PLEO|nr:hypothetical protein EJ02DRAFT_457164 [Clathrospora elynae]